MYECGSELCYRWFCHFDDDVYLNIRTLSTQLRKYNSSRRYYLGHWLSKRGKDPLTGGNFKQFPEAKRTSYFYATGPAYCISSALLKDVERYFRGKKLNSTCHKMGLTQDLTLGAIISNNNHVIVAR